MNFLCPALMSGSLCLYRLGNSLIKGRETRGSRWCHDLNIPTSAKKNSTEKRKFVLRPRARKR
ncbi:unnamed protein product [Musa acuminata var. zebrina]